MGDDHRRTRRPVGTVLFLLLLAVLPLAYAVELECDPVVVPPKEAGAAEAPR